MDASALSGVGRARIPQIDSLRVFAATAVLYNHSSGIEDRFGQWGVQLFFVISGFLITGLLLEARGTGRREAAAPLRNFFIRRSLRIWPAYYALLSVFLILNWSDIRDSALWHVFYLTNVYFFINDTWDPWIVDHFWSLAVEEQFYLIWPLVIYGVSRANLRWLLPTIGLLSWIGADTFERQGWNGENFAAAGLLPFSLLSLAFGAILALWRVERSPLLALVPWLGLFGFLAHVLAVAIYGPMILGVSWLMPLESACFAALVHFVSLQRPGPVTTVLSNPVLIYLGTVSYGIYLYHGAALYLLGEWEHGPNLALGWTMFGCTFVLSTLLAAISWHALEKPLNGLKRFFPFGRAAVPALEPAPEGVPALVRVADPA